MVELMTQNVDNIAEGVTKNLVEGKMGNLIALLNDFNDCVRAFSERGWMKRAWIMRKHVKTLSRLDKDIVAPGVPELARGPLKKIEARLGISPR